eukprot:409971-Karenia_brevis.AAC.1
MGAAAQGEFESMLGPMQKRLVPAVERLHTAKRFARRLQDYLFGADDCNSLHVAWCLAARSLKEALAYDIRVCPADVMEPLLTELTSCLREVACQIHGSPFSDLLWRRLQLPGPLGGMGMRMAMTSADAAFIATYLATERRVKFVCSELKRPTRANVGKSEAVAAGVRLEAKGVKVAFDGKVTLMPEAEELYSHGPWSQDTPMNELTDFTPR